MLAAVSAVTDSYSGGGHSFGATYGDRDHTRPGGIVRQHGCWPAGAAISVIQAISKLAEAHQQQDLLAAMLEPHTPADGASTEWPLRGEILSHVDRLRTTLQAEMPEIPRRPPRGARRAAHPLTVRRRTAGRGT